jgi:uncharacterized protein YkwD
VALARHERIRADAPRDGGAGTGGNRTVTGFNFIDALLAVIVLFGIWSGVRRGLVFATLHLVTLVTCFGLAFIGYPFAAKWLQQAWPATGVWAAPIGFVVTFVLAELVLGTLANRIAHGFPLKLHRNPVNRILGLAPGAVNGLINATLVSMILVSAPIHEDVTTAARESAAANLLAQPAEWVEAQLTPIFDPAIRRALQAITVPPDPHTSIALHFKVTDASPRPDLEARMLEMVNEERAKQGLKSLKADPEMLEVARAHSRDMLARGYFAHVAPDGKDLEQRVRKANVRFLVAGENLALAPTLARAHDGLMNSPGHRANILRAQFGRVGIGVLDGGRYGLMITQNFRN